MIQYFYRLCSIKSYHKMMAITTEPYNIFLFLIYFIHSSLCLLILFPEFALLSCFPLVTPSLLSTSVHLFLFCIIHSFALLFRFYI